ncbi:MAG: DEAD/DEAH box helicase [Candidatus Micrarchaeales archaeon]|nr:DEAD/DEAH box helicase [Candidatus Micrarchaeales archaeon]
MICIADIYDIFLKRYKTYTGIQKLALPIIEKLENCIIIAPTGSGKTEAAVLPVFDRIAKDPDRSGIKLLYITPLRALNRDMIKRLEQMCAEAGITIAVRHGDTTQSERGKQARHAPQVLITTPETLQSVLPTKSIGPSLKNVKAVIIDEIHELYFNKRGAQLSVALERLEELSPGFQRIGISATVGDPEQISKYLCNERPCRTAQVLHRKEMSLRVELPRTHAKHLDELANRFGLDSDALGRLNAIAENVKDSKSTIIFANTRQVVEALGSRLLHLNSIEPFGGIGVHHSSLDRMERIKIENEFKEGRLKSIIATSSLELGIDIGNVDLVIQYGSPRQALRLIQRVGRSGHTEKGAAKGLVLATNTMDAIEASAIFSNVAEGVLERYKPQSNALDVLANQICGIALDKGSCGIDQLSSIVRRSYIYKDFPREKLAWLLEFMNKHRMVGFDGSNISSGPRTRMYYYGHLSVIPDSKRFLIKNVADNRIISSLDEGFVVSAVDENSVFITKGLPWKVISIDENVITVEPSSDLEAAIPDWSGEDIPVSGKVTGKVFTIFNNPEIISNADQEAKGEMKEFIAAQEKIGLPSADRLIIEQGDEYVILHTGLGTLANEALSRLLAFRLTARVGRSVNMKSSPYMIFFELPSSIRIEPVLRETAEHDVEKLLANTMQETELFRYKFVTVAKLFGIIDKEAPMSKSITRRVMKVLQDSPVYAETSRELMQNYFDIETLAKFFSAISSGRMKIWTVAAGTLSPIAKMILNSAYYTKELVMPLLPSDELIASFSKYLLSKNIKLLCTYCGMHFSRKLNEIKDEKEIKCPNCASPMIAPFSEEYNAVIKKRIDGKRLTAAERKELREIMKQASLFDSYGGRAALALSTYGVGPTSAARILMMLRRQEHLFFTDLIEAQKTFIKNKKYWSI